MKKKKPIKKEKVIADCQIFLSVRQVVKMVGISRATLWRLENERLFPRRRMIAARRIGWIKAEVEAWAASRPEVKDYY